MGEVINLDAPTLLDLPAEKVLQAAIDTKLDVAMVIGENGDGIYHASTTSDIAEMLLLIEIVKRELLARATI